MKKRYIFLLAFVAMITLAGCKKDSKFSVDEIGTNIDLADAWMKQVSYSDTAINEFDEKKDHYVVYIPTDITSSLKVNVIDVESSITDRFHSFHIPYATATTFTVSAANSLIGIYTNYFKDDNKLNLGFEASIPTKWSQTVTLGDCKEQQEGKVRALYTVYMPTYVEHYGVYSKEVKCDIKSYVLIPVAYGLTYAQTSDLKSSLENVSDDIKSLTSVTLYANNGILVNQPKENE